MNKKTINLSSQGHEAISRISSNLKGDRQKESEIVFNSLLKLLFTIKALSFSTSMVYQSFPVLGALMLQINCDKFK
jgi:hypothetical protein